MPSPNSKNIRQANKSDLAEIVRIHKKAFPGFFLTNLGGAFIRTYYTMLLEKEEPFFVLLGEENKVLGFVCGLIDSKEFYVYLKINSYRFILPLLRSKALLRLFNEIISKIWNVFVTGKVNTVDSIENSAELTSIAVDPSYSGAGAGGILLDYFLEHIDKEKRLKSVHLTTDAQANDYVLSFYFKYGFEKRAVFLQGRNREMLIMERRN